MLERALELATCRSERRASATPLTHRQAPRHPFLFVEPRFFFNATVYASLAGPAGARQTGPSVPAPDLFRPARPLVARREGALELGTLGADLPADFTAAELRRAFRALARRYHPDSRPGSSDATKTRLSRRFADLIEDYRRLRAALEPVGSIRH